MKIRGLVRWFNPAKGYGFIAVEGEADLYFVHHQSVREEIKTLVAGEIVEFDSAPNAKGLIAINVSRLIPTVFVDLDGRTEQ